MSELDLFDPHPRSHADGPETERAAAGRVSEHVEALRREVLAALEKAGTRGLTGFEMCSRFPANPESTVRTRLTELADDHGLAVRSKWRRKNGRNSWEVVWLHRRHYDRGQHDSEWDDPAPPRINEHPTAKALRAMASQRWRPSQERAVLASAAKLIDGK